VLREVAAYLTALVPSPIASGTSLAAAALGSTTLLKTAKRIFGPGATLTIEDRDDGGSGRESVLVVSAQGVPEERIRALSAFIDAIWDSPELACFRELRVDTSRHGTV